MRNQLSPLVLEKRQSVFNKLGIKEKNKCVNICETISHAENQVQLLKHEMDMIYYSYMNDKDKIMIKNNFAIQENNRKEKKLVNKVKLKDLQKLFNGSTTQLKGKKNKINFNKNSPLIKNGKLIQLNSIDNMLSDRQSTRYDTIENNEVNVYNTLNTLSEKEDKNLNFSRKNSKFKFSNFAQYVNTTCSLNKYSTNYQTYQSNQTEPNDLVTVTYVDTIDCKDEKNDNFDKSEKNENKEKNSQTYLHSNSSVSPKKNSLFKIKKSLNMTRENFMENILESGLSNYKRNSKNNMIIANQHRDSEISIKNLPEKNLSLKKYFKLESNRTTTSVNSTLNDFFSTKTGKSNFPNPSINKTDQFKSKSFLDLLSEKNKNSTSNLFLQTNQPDSKTNRTSKKEKLVIKNINHYLSEAYKCGDDLKLSVMQTKTNNRDISLQKEKIKEKLDEQMVNDKKSLGGFGNLKEKLRKGFYTLESVDRLIPSEKIVYKTFDRDGVIKRYEKINFIREEDKEKTKEILERDYGVNHISPAELAHQQKLSKNKAKRSRVKDMLIQLDIHRKKLENMTKGISPRESYND